MFRILTGDEREKLVKNLGEKQTNVPIKRPSRCMASAGRYKDHRATLLVRHNMPQSRRFQVNVKHLRRKKKYMEAKLERITRERVI
jgi:hypothetical protein